MIQTYNLVAGEIVKGSIVENNISPIDSSVISQVHALSTDQVRKVFSNIQNDLEDAEIESYVELARLSKYILNNREKFIEQIMLDAGFIYTDARDLVDGSIEFCRDYKKHRAEIASKDMVSSYSFASGSTKKIKLTSLPYGLIAATTPRNTPLITELIIIVHALWSGNSLVLRPSFGVSGTIALLIEALRSCLLPKTLSRLHIVFSSAKDFIDAALDHAQLLHYVGSSKYLEQTLIAGIKKGVKVLVDGDGSSMIVVDKSANHEKAARACYDALIRCNGQICISARVILVEKSLYDVFCKTFLSYIKKMNIEPPSMTGQTAMGPLFSAAQVENIIHVAKKYKVLHGSLQELSYGKNYLEPIILNLKSDDRLFLRESLFGPLLGIACYERDGWINWLNENPINLTDVVFSNDQQFIRKFLKVSKSPRKVVNNDPTLESVFEPWGAFLPSGWNDVSQWYYKYRKVYQLVAG